MRKFLLCAVGVCLLLVSAPLQAQETPILARLMRLVPFEQLSGNDLLSYVDYAALQKALPDSERPASFEDLQARRETPSVEWYMTGVRFAASGDSNLVSASLDRMRESVGFDFFSIDQVMTFGNAPSNGRLYTGRFGTQAVEAAFLARDYTKVERDGVNVFCGDPACDPALALRVNVLDRRVGDPFGGSLGRREPIALAPSLIMNSPDMRVFDAMVAAYSGGSPSLAQNADMRALLNVLTAEGTIVQANFFNPYIIGPVQRGDVGIAPYGSGALVHVLREDGAQPVYIALTYAEESAAQATGEVLATRIQNYQSITARRPFADLLAARGGTLAAAQVVQPEAGAPFVLLLPVSSAPPTGIPAERNDFGYRRRSDAMMIYSLLVDALYGRDLGFLAISP